MIQEAHVIVDVFREQARSYGRRLGQASSHNIRFQYWRRDTPGLLGSRPCATACLYR
ncbi:hypothetical protein METHPM2_90016 [Pseudomonas sp. PM2]